MIRIDNLYIKKANATGVSIHTVHESTLINTSNAFPINHQQQPCGTDKYENAHAKAVTIEFFRMQERELSTLRTF